MDRTDFWRITGDGIHKGLASFWMLVKVVVPVYIALTVLGRTPVLPWIAGVCAPFMKYWGLPGDAATALVIGMTINIYACIGATVALGLTPAQITIIGVIIGISHNNIMETAILRKTGAPVGVLVPIRIIGGLVLGLIVAAVYRMAG